MRVLVFVILIALLGFSVKTFLDNQRLKDVNAQLEAQVHDLQSKADAGAGRRFSPSVTTLDAPKYHR